MRLFVSLLLVEARAGGLGVLDLDRVEAHSEAIAEAARLLQDARSRPDPTAWMRDDPPPHDAEPYTIREMLGEIDEKDTLTGMFDFGDISLPVEIDPDLRAELGIDQLFDSLPELFDSPAKPSEKKSEAERKKAKPSEKSDADREHLEHFLFDLFMEQGLRDLGFEHGFSLFEEEPDSLSEEESSMLQEKLRRATLAQLDGPCVSVRGERDAFIHPRAAVFHRDAVDKTDAFIACLDRAGPEPLLQTLAFQDPESEPLVRRALSGR